MSLTHRTLALFTFAITATGAVAAPADAPVKRLGKTVVQYQDARARAVLSWRYANQTFATEPWLPGGQRPRSGRMSKGTIAAPSGSACLVDMVRRQTTRSTRTSLQHRRRGCGS